MITLDAETALVTGASRGIGRGIALKLAQSGVARIAVHYHKNVDAAEETAAMVRQHGTEPLLVQADACSLDDLDRMMAEVRAAYGTLDIFVQNARPDIGEFYVPVPDISLDQWQTAFDSQARALLVGARKAADFMTEGGRIIAVTYGPGGQTGSWRPWVAMGSAKAAMEALCRYLAWDLAGSGITVNAVSPGATDDSVFNTLPSEVLGSIRDWAERGWVPMRRLTTPADVGNLVALLSMPDAGFVTGQLIHVDGGASLALADFPMPIQKGA